MGGGGQINDTFFKFCAFAFVLKKNCLSKSGLCMCSADMILEHEGKIFSFGESGRKVSELRHKERIHLLLHDHMLANPLSLLGIVQSPLFNLK